MKQTIGFTLAAMLLSLAFSGMAMAEEDMDVTMEMVQDDESLKDFVVHEMPLPPAASQTGREASEKGRNQAREARQRVDEARERGREARDQRSRRMELPDRADRPEGGGDRPSSSVDSGTRGSGNSNR